MCSISENIITSRTAAGRLFNAHFSAVTQKPWCSLSYNNKADIGNDTKMN